MPNSATHQALAALMVGGAFAGQDALNGLQTPKPIIGAALAGILGTLPDKLEPAIANPHHRQFFHSVTLAVIVGAYEWHVWNWQPQDEWEEYLRLFLLAAGGAYLSHLVADACTRRSLPLLGKINF